MVSKAWKELEKHVAEKLGGRRLSSASYAESQPDVVVDTISNPTLGATVYDRHISLLVECKYRSDNPWQRLVSGRLNQIEGRIPLATCEDVTFWDLRDTKEVMSFLFGAPTNKSSLVHVLQKFSIFALDRKIPKFIYSSLGQAATYGDWAWENAVLWVPTVCLGQKGAHTKIMCSLTKDLWGIRTEYGRRQAALTHRGGNQPSDLD